MTSKVSVIVPCFNQAEFLDQTLQSVLNQTYTSWECIIVNDGSTDGTETIALKWIKKDKRFKYFYKKNGGLSSARNFGLRKANGVYIQFLDSDDLLQSEKFESQLSDLRHCDISISDYFSFADNDLNQKVPHRYLSPFLSEAYFKKEIILDWEYRKSIPCHSVLFKKELINKNKLTFDEYLPNHEDWVFWVQLFYFSKSIKNNKNEFALYRIHNRSMSVDFKLMKQGFLEAAKILQIFFKNENNEMLYKLSKEKYKEIYHKNRVPFLKKMKRKIYSKLASCYRYVRKN
tara:strand:- start:5004 stop:5867 length:864 start_codon:yes stop_codon:yes gene_type:complete